MTLLANIEDLTQEQLDYMQQKIMLRKHDLLQKQVEELTNTASRLVAQVDYQQTELQTAIHRIDNLDLTNIEGTPQQRFNKMIRLYAVRNGIQFDKGYKEFTQAYNLAFKANLTALHEHYKERKGNCTMPEFLNESGKMEDAIRVADKMLNKRLPLKAVN